MNPLAELNALVEPFPEAEPLITKVEHVAAPLMPESYRVMLAHEHHMTVTMERHHGLVDVAVLDRREVGGLYCRKSILTKRNTGEIVQLGFIRFDFQYVTADVRDEIVSESIPLGRVLIEHDVLRHIDLGALLRIEAGPGLAKLFRMPVGGVTYGRLATIFCNGRPAVDLLEITAPLG